MLGASTDSHLAEYVHPMTDAATNWDDATLRALLTEQSDLLLTHLRSFDETAAREPSLLPGWSRGHVLTHLARNADSLANSAAGALLGRPLPRYLSTQQRDQDIEAGSNRPADQLLADLATSSGRMLALLGTAASTPPDVQQPDGRGGTVRIGELPWLRLREVVYHHVDLDLGYSFDDAPTLVLRAGLLECPARLASTSPGLELTCTFADAAPLQILMGDGHRAVEGSGADILAWLTGRSDGAGLTTSGSSLPALPSWG